MVAGANATGSGAGTKVGQFVPTGNGYSWAINSVPVLDIADTGAVTFSSNNSGVSHAIYGAKLLYANNTAADSQFIIAANTSDAADNQALLLCSGGALGGTRGASISLYGNEADFGANAQGLVAIAAGTRNASTANAITFSAGATDAIVMAITEAGEVALGPDSTARTHRLRGSYNNTSATTANLAISSTDEIIRATSALKYKENIEPLTYGLSEILDMQPVFYKSKCEMDKHLGRCIGLIADWEQSRLPELVEVRPDTGEVENFEYAKLTAVIVKAMQEQQAMIEQLNAKIEALEARLET
jgi:hypothetical protein